MRARSTPTHPHNTHTLTHTHSLTPSRRYDKAKIVLKEIMNCQYAACMNPTAGSFNITPRMQRQFVTLAVQMPSAEIVRSVYHQVRMRAWGVGGSVRLWVPLPSSLQQ